MTWWRSLNLEDFPCERLARLASLSLDVDVRLKVRLKSGASTTLVGRNAVLLAGGEQVEVGTLGLGLRGKIILFAEAAVNAAGDERSGGADDLAGAAAEKHG